MKNKRIRGIGGTAISAIIGQNPYKNAIDVFLDQTSQTIEREPNEAMEWGKKLEKLVAKETAKREDKTLVWLDKTMRHEKYPFLIGTPDGMLNAPSTGKELLEVKTSGLRSSGIWGDPGSDDIPPHYYTQVAWYMMLTNLDQATLSVLIGGQELRIFHIKRDRELEDMLVETAVKFWQDHIEKMVVPELDGSESAERYLKMRYPSNKVADLLPALPEDIEAMQKLARTKAALAQIETEERALENYLKDRIGETSGLDAGEGIGRVTWTQNKPTTKTDWKGIVTELNDDVGVAQGLINKYTTEQPGARVFRASVKE